MIRWVNAPHMVSYIFSSHPETGSIQFYEQEPVHHCHGCGADLRPLWQDYRRDWYAIYVLSSFPRVAYPACSPECRDLVLARDQAERILKALSW